MLSKIIDYLQSFMASHQGEFYTIESDLQHIQQEVSGELVQMESWAWQSPLIRFARLTHLHSPQRIQMFNLTIYPQHHILGAMFASDWVILNGKLRIGVIDTMPFFQDDVYQHHWVQPFEKLHKESLQIAPIYERTADWSFDYLSPNACLATQITNLQPLIELWKQYLHTYFSCLQQAPFADLHQQKAQVMWQNQYNREHLEVELKRNPLLHYFGKTWGERYLQDFLFSPIHLPNEML